MYKFLLSIGIIFFLLACSRDTLDASTNRQSLTCTLQSLSSNISHEEAQSLAIEIYGQTKLLRKKFDPVFEPHMNNFLINVGLKEQGLCYEWSNALYLYFKKQEYAHFTFHLLVADQGKYFFEHNVLVVSAKGEPVMHGIIIDPWRKPGALYFSKVKEDKRYKWKHRKEHEI